MLDSPWLKIKWAEAHIKDLQALANQVPWADFYRFFVRDEVETRKSVISFEVTKSIPPEISLFVGDICHNLRSSLDHFASGMYASLTGLPADHIYFPFGSTRHNIESSTRYKKIQLAAPDVFDLILDKIRPYDPNHGGNSLLWAVNQLDRADKHRIINPTLAVTAITGVNAVDQNNNRVINGTLIVRGTGVVHGFGGVGSFHIESYREPTVAIVFGDSDAFEGQPVIPTLFQMLEATAGAIETLETYLFGERADDSHAIPPEGGKE